MIYRTTENTIFVHHQAFYSKYPAKEGSLPIVPHRWVRSLLPRFERPQRHSIRQVTYTAPFTLQNRDTDYATVWAKLDANR